MPKQNIKQHSVASKLDEPIYSSKQSLLFKNRPQRTATGQLLLEVALFATENRSFRERRDRAAGYRAQIHLRRVKELSEQLQAELATLLMNNS